MGTPANERNNQPFLRFVCVSATFAPSASASDKKPTVYLNPPIHKQLQIYSPALSHRETTQAHGLPGLQVPDICIARKAKNLQKKCPFCPCTACHPLIFNILDPRGNIADKIHIGDWELSLLRKWVVENENFEDVGSLGLNANGEIKSFWVQKPEETWGVERMEGNTTALELFSPTMINWTNKKMTS